MIIEKLIEEEKSPSSPNSREIEELKKVLPSYFTKDGDFMLDKFESMLKSDDVSVNKEGYELNFLGKSYARLEGALPTETVISPDVTHNSKEENKNSENLYIVGDNLDALKHMLDSYTGRVKCAYIDPPYNTGSDEFVYPDSFEMTPQELAGRIGMTEEEAERTIAMAGKSTHSAWLTFMYPRLTLARSLLAEDGVIFISIDDNEQANLKLLCDDVFGEENFIANVVWKHTQQSKNDEMYFSRQYNDIVVYGKERMCLPRFFFERTDKDNKNYSNPDNDPKGMWRRGDVRSPNSRPTLMYPVYTPIRTEIPPPQKGWRWSKETMEDKMRCGEIIFTDDYTGIIRKIYLTNQIGRTPENLWSGEEFGTTRTANSEIKSLFGATIFDTPKPTQLIKKIMEISMDKNSIILDFFSGSATTAHAVMDLNAQDGGNRKYIMVQLPEPTKENSEAYKAGYKTIDEIGRARIERAAAKIKEETKADIDYGYKAYYLHTPTEKTIDKLISFEKSLDIQMEGYEDTVSLFNYKDSTGKQTMLTTWVNQDGYGLTVEPTPYPLAGYTADLCGNSLYVIEKGLSEKDVSVLISRVENGELNISEVVYYPYSVGFTVATSLKNLSNLDFASIKVVRRY